MSAPIPARRRSDGSDKASRFFIGATTLATWSIIGILAVILFNVVWNGWNGISWNFVTGGSGDGGILPTIVGTAMRVILMAIFVMPLGVMTAVYLSEYARPSAIYTRVVRSAVDNLAGVPSIVFGLFGLGFFINFVGASMDDLGGVTQPVWGKPALLWASLTMAVMTLPVVIVTTEDSLRAIPSGMREASLALGATRAQTLFRVLLPNAMPGILTGAILSISRAAGEVAPILFTGAAYYIKDYPGSLSDQFKDLGHHVWVLATQSPNIDQTRPVLYATVLVLLALTFVLNVASMFARARFRRKLRLLY